MHTYENNTIFKLGVSATNSIFRMGLITFWKKALHILIQYVRYIRLFYSWMCWFITFIQYIQYIWTFLYLDVSVH